MIDKSLVPLGRTMNPSTRRPLLGVTIMLIEDSRYCSEAIRLLALKSGARLRRADSLKSARRHLAIYRPNVVLVDLGLPDGSGLEIISELRSLGASAPVIIASSGEDPAAVGIDITQIGADAFLPKPLKDLANFQQAILTHLNESDGPRKFEPRLIGTEVTPDRKALHEDLEYVGTLLSRALLDKDRRVMEYCAQFLKCVGVMAEDRDLKKAAGALAHRLADGFPGQVKGTNALHLVNDRLSGFQVM